MNKTEITRYLAALDGALSATATLHLYGSAVIILLDAPERASLDIDVAGAYSRVNRADFERAAGTIGLPVNPEPVFSAPHIEWVGPLRLCLPPPDDDIMVLWQGEKLTVRTGSVEDLVASKLIRYDSTDRADVQFLYSQYAFDFHAIEKSVSRLPRQFRNDAMVIANLGNLLGDIEIWRGGGK